MNKGWYNYFEEDDSADIINRYKKMLDKKSSCYFDVHEFENIVDYYINHNDYKSAIQSVKTGLVQHPGSVILKLKYVQVLIDSGKATKALRMLDYLAEVEFYNHEVHLLKGKAFNSLLKEKDAIPEFEKAINLSKENKDDVIYEVALSFIQTDNLEVAIKYLLLAYEENETNLLVIYDLALCYERLDDVDKSIFFYNKFLDTDPFAENIWFNLGLLYSSTGKYKDAINAFDYSIAICPENSAVYFSKAETLANSGKYWDAVKVYKDLLEIENENSHAFSCMGDCFDKLGEYKSALKSYIMAARIEDRNSEAWYGIGLMYSKLKKYQSSISNLKKAIKIEPDNPDYWFMLGEVYSKINIYNDAVKAFTKTLEIDPENYKCWLAYSKMYYRRNRIDDAIEILKKGYKYNKNISTINYQLAAYHIYNDQPGTACRYFEKGLALNFREHHIVLDLFPKTRKNKEIIRLVIKHQNQK